MGINKGKYSRKHPSKLKMMKMVVKTSERTDSVRDKPEKPESLSESVLELPDFLVLDCPSAFLLVLLI